MTWVSIVAVIVAPVAAVLIGQLLQDRAEKRRDKMEVFRAVMTYRYGWSQEAVLALNSIPIVFSKDKPVRDYWKIYYSLLCIQEPNPIEIKQRTDALYKLIESMAMVLGYKDTIKWDDIQNPYIPVGMASSFNNNMIIQNSMATLLQNLTTNTTQVQSSNGDRITQETN